MRSLAWDFNREMIFGELGAFVGANLAAVLVSHFTRDAAAVSFSAIPGTVIGGSAFWLSARIYDQVTGGRFKPRGLAGDIACFTPAAFVLSVLAYDPAIYLISHELLRRGNPVSASILAGQLVAFALFLLGMNAYRAMLFRATGKCL
jgi:hypothetical protein